MPSWCDAPRWRREWWLLLLAVQALTRLPVRAPWREGALREATRYFPLVGALVGAVAAMVFGLLRPGLGPVVASVLSLAATLLLTGALHEDGWADCCDGLGARTRADALAIMKDSRVGAYAVLGLGVVLGAKVALVAGMPPGRAAGALVAGHAAGRLWLLLPPLLLPYARDEGIARGVAAPGVVEVGVAAVVAGLALLSLGWGRAGMALLVSAGAAALVAWAARRLLGGYTGDVLGATAVLGELGVLLAAGWR